MLWFKISSWFINKPTNLREFLHYWWQKSIKESSQFFTWKHFCHKTCFPFKIILLNFWIWMKFVLWTSETAYVTKCSCWNTRNFEELLLLWVGGKIAAFRSHQGFLLSILYSYLNSESCFLLDRLISVQKCVLPCDIVRVLERL